jgi:glycosyltransferase involved in cell wall biosynthesis
MNPVITIVTPASRNVRYLSRLVRDFRNQTLPKNLYEHIIVYDGKPPEDVLLFMEAHKNDYDLKFVWIDKDMGDMKQSPGTNPRNHGISLAKGEYICFADDDDRYKDTYCEMLVSGVSEKAITVVQMSCQESRIYRNGNPRHIVLVPEVGLSEFPVICHVGTPCFVLPRRWALEDPWRHEPEHDFRFIKRIVEKHRPQIYMRYGMFVDVDSLVIGDLADWVSIPPFFRGV